MEYELHVQRAENAYKAFLILKKEGLIQDAISSRHHAIIHLCYAILLKNGIEIPKTHSGLIARIWKMREQLGVHERVIGLISRLQSLRESGDYGVIVSVEEKDLEIVEEVYRALRGLV
ncbi:MAG: HEPN domain-containing protein [Archaeoglobaceae archaeon]